MKTAAVLVVVLGSAVAQDMRENCVSCGDTKRRCEIDCMLPTYRTSQDFAWPNNKPETYDDMATCTTGCLTDYETCSETTEQAACFTCISSCATYYEANMLSCLQGIEDTTSVATVDDSMDDCAVNATFSMNVCSETCYDADVYGGWTPSTEEGVSGEDGLAINMAVPDYRAVAVSIEDFAKYSQVSTKTMRSRAKQSSRAQAAATELAAVSPQGIVTAEEELAQKMGVGGILGVSSLVATVMLSVGLITVRHLKGEMTAEETSV